MKKKNILIPLFQEYYLFEYFKYLIPILCKDDHNVILLSFNEKVLNSIENNKNLTKVNGSRVIRFLYNRNGKYRYYILLWPLAYIWAFILKFRYSLDCAILPWDNKTIWYAFSKVIPSMTIHNTTEYMNLDSILDRDKVSKSPLYKSVWHKVYSFIDSLFGKKFFYRLDDKVLFYDHHLFWDRLFGKRSKVNFLGFSEVKYISVTGNVIRDNLIRAGLKSEKVLPFGNPSYDFLDELRASWNETVKKEFLLSEEIDDSKKVYTLFLSPSKFSEIQRKEIIEVIQTIYNEEKNSFFIVKFHPKTRQSDPPLFNKEISEITQSFKIITSFGGDLYNAKLMLVSDLVVQKQCTLGFLAVRLKIPMLSYNIYQTEYEDDMYKYLNASIHCESLEEVKNGLRDLKNNPKKLEDLQEIASLNYSIDMNASKEISKLIKTSF
ncbi:MAG: UDP-N-acetyl glucosamine 2-epimerase [Oligoflexia bacterium]|nr:UDP-N-acetyl glucosamine 2-epimerase [Oligoflexia bacterium]